MHLSEFTIKTEILISFAAIVTTTLLIITLVSVNNVNTLGNSIEDETIGALQSQIIDNMKSSSTENARIITQKFANAEATINKIVEATENAFSGRYNITPLNSYRDTEIQQIPNSSLNNEYGEIISSTTSTYYYPKSTDGSWKATLDMNQTIELSSILDKSFSNIWENNQEFVWLYVSFENGIFRNFPGATVDKNGEYLPKNEDWYVNSIGNTKIQYSNPYFDITQGMVVSLTQAVYVNGVAIGVVGLDFKTITIQEKVLDVNFLESGYAALFQKDLTLVAHPEWDSSKLTENDPIPMITDIERDQNGSIAYSKELIFQLQNFQNGTSNYIRNNENYYISFVQIYKGDGTLQYIFTITVNTNEVLNPVNEIKNEIDSSISNTIMTTILLGIFTLIGALVIGLKLATEITEPIEDLTEMATRIIQNITSKNIFEGVKLDTSDIEDHEIGELANSFSEMVKTLREEQIKNKK